MCGRFSLDATLEDLYIALKIKGRFNLMARYNIAPGQPILTLRNHPEKVAREFVHFRWGLVPSWMKEPPRDTTLINARVETVNEKPSFRNAYRRRRCLIPATGFYEWKRETSYKQPYHIYLKNERVFTFAGIWERWQGGEGSELETAAILTAEANPSIRHLHERMPVIVRQEDHDDWLSGRKTGMDVLQEDKNLKFAYYPVSRRVNNVANDDPSLIEEVESAAKGPEQKGLF